MLTIPDDVELWDRKLILNFIKESYDENEVLEFKSDLNFKTEKIPKTVCAFANTRGGTLIIGVDNDRKKDLTAKERLIGVNDDDDLKPRILHQIQEIKPQLGLEKTNFKSSNINVKDDKVIVILKILPSKIDGPHQYKNVFYKRNIGMNAAMSVDEIKNAILDSRKTEQSLFQLMYEAGTIRRKLKLVRKEFQEHRDIEFSVEQCGLIPTNSLNFFLYNQSYLYENDLHVSITRVIEEIIKLKTLTLPLYEYSKTSIEDEFYRNKLKKEFGFDSAEDFVIHTSVSRIDIALNELEKFEKYTGKKIIDAIYSDEPLPYGY